MRMTYHFGGFGGFLVSDTSAFSHTFAVGIMKVIMKLKFV